MQSTTPGTGMLEGANIVWLFLVFSTCNVLGFTLVLALTCAEIKDNSNLSFVFTIILLYNYYISNLTISTGSQHDFCYWLFGSPI